jgi:membrane-associated protease RseP (regulator of RpoE activity)
MAHSHIGHDVVVGDDCEICTSTVIGGYVAIEGMEVDSKVADGFNTKPIFQRMVVLSAGVIMNFLMAFILIFSLLKYE